MRYIQGAKKHIQSDEDDKARSMFIAKEKRKWTTALSNIRCSNESKGWIEVLTAKSKSLYQCLSTLWLVVADAVQSYVMWAARYFKISPVTQCWSGGKGRKFNGIPSVWPYLAWWSCEHFSQQVLSPGCQIYIVFPSSQQDFHRVHWLLQLKTPA